MRFFSITVESRYVEFTYIEIPLISKFEAPVPPNAMLINTKDHGISNSLLSKSLLY